MMAEQSSLLPTRLGRMRTWKRSSQGRACRTIGWDQKYSQDGSNHHQMVSSMSSPNANDTHVKPSTLGRYDGSWKSPEEVRK